MASNPPLCPCCGAAGDPGDRFCQACGRDLLVPPPPPAAVAPAPYPTPPPLPPPTPSGPPAWALGVIAIGAVALLAAGGWLGYRLLAPGVAPPGREEPAPDPSVPPAMEPDSEPAPLEGGAASDAEGAAGKVGGAEAGEHASAAEPDPPAPAEQEKPAQPQDRPTATSRPAAETRRPAPSPTPPTPVETVLKPEPPASPPAVAAPSPAPPATAQPSDPPPAFSRTYTCRETAEFHVDPEEALVTVDGKLIGKADDWDGMAFGKGHRFPGPGAYTVKLSLEGYRTEWVRIVVNPQAKKKTAKVELELAEE